MTGSIDPGRGDEPRGAGRRALLIIGHRCAGKTTAGDFIRRNFALQVYEASDVFQAIATERNVKIGDSDRALAFLRSHGMALVAQRIMADAERTRLSRIVVTGFRTVEEVGYLAGRGVGVTMVRLTADPAVRLARLAARRGERLTPADLAVVDQAEARFGLLPVAADLADRSIASDCPLRVYLERIATVVDRHLPAVGRDRLS